MILDKNQLVKSVKDAPQNNLLLLTATPLVKDSAKSVIDELTKYLQKNNDCTVIVIKK
jgi:hypothetical protein